MAHQVLWQKLSFQKVDPANPTVPVGDPEIVLRGELVPDYVDSFTINSLANAGMIVPVTVRPDPTITPLIAEPAQPVGPDTPIVLPDGTSTIVPLDADAGVTPESAPEKPKATDTRDKWESYAVAIGMDQGTVEAEPNKAAVIAAVESFESEPV